jgi:hypothetical protein
MVTWLQRYIRPCIVVYYFLLRFCKQVFWEKFQTRAQRRYEKFVSLPEGQVFSFRNGPGYGAANKDPWFHSGIPTENHSHLHLGF